MPMAGIEPATSPLPRECSTTEPHGRDANFGAGDEARTRDIQFGKLKLYQLSYTRAFEQARKILWQSCTT